MLKIKTNNFDLDSTMLCGQAFRYYVLEDNSYDIILRDRVINVKKENEYLIIDSNNYENLEEIVVNYFDLNTDYEKICKYLIVKDNLLKDSIEFSKGLNILRQDPFEMIVSYIISANNSVRNITNSLNDIAFNYGKKVIFNNKEYYLFPRCEDLKDVTKEEFRLCKTGFRDKYLVDFIYKLNNKLIDLDIIFNMNTEEALEYLMNLKGIGTKVASCILLFAYYKFDVFPIDTWVKKIVKELYNIEGQENIKNFAKDKYGMYCGIALQYMFNYSRNKTN